MLRGHGRALPSLQSANLVKIRDNNKIIHYFCRNKTNLHMPTRIECPAPGDLPQAARRVLVAIGGRRAVALVGAMGAGKTTLVSQICRELGAVDEASSPTFSIVNEYEVPGSLPVYHFDFYRLESPQEALDMGVEDYFDSGALCLMEWPDRIGDLLPDDCATVEIEELPDGSRVFTVS